MFLDAHLDNRRHIVKERPTVFPATAMPTVMSPDNPSIGSTWFQSKDGMTLVYIPDGEFQMGTEDSSNDGFNEKPVHTVYLDAYWIDKTEVTNLMYAKCVADGACDPPQIHDAHSIQDGYYVSEEFDDYPVLKVSWLDSTAYCTWAGRRLPTEAEWEKAARGGLEGKRYPWGDTAPICEEGAENGARFTVSDSDAGCDDENTTKVASYSPNGYGLYDMVGNASEWVADLHSKLYSDDYYANSPYSNPLGVDLGDGRMQRGSSGNSYDNLDDLGVARRYAGDPDKGSLSVGFRCALSP